MENFLDKLLWTPPFGELTINRVYLSTSFRNFIFIVIVLTFFITVLIIKKSHRTSFAFKKATIVAFFISGLLYALQADHTWGAWLSDYVRVFSGIGTDEKLLRLEGEIYDFSRLVRPSIGSKYELFSSQNRKALRTEYFLLPLRRREQAPYIVVFDDRDALFEPATHTFRHDGALYKDVDLLFEFSNNAYVLKRRLR